ncbi:2-C-methyl-D-erythritol 4-phosphate cytidylyltransferase [Paenibacillus phyllosphaerae]|uniref:2-C-methyl-D-erythritol 4-phosphate cytidylyltransferase n=1 Tax=Paenibacillus phyllosphaerae TaxID=274593 RepID=A0A7W5B4L1_9BACL|nr:2-C-methyl-D-erythritol 4-phosphate cytidylyltransferase [Paenibacillus phyllosphaerae]MBB3114263.1 2-C-methyl-D-erythritol 4-phosphate cytidylyltransferase [Paenibacillus phyllosphaerae]
MAGTSAAWGVVVVAAGRGTRMGTAESKQYLLLQDKPVLVHTLEIFESMAEIREIALVVGSMDVERCEALVAQYGLSKVRAVVAGGSERQHSVLRGLHALDTEWVMVHDGVRPLVSPAAVRACAAAAQQSEAAVLAVPVKDTIKQVNEEGVIVATPDRRSLWAIQTPQAFRRALLLEAHEKAADSGFVGTDDAVVVERFGGVPVVVAEGEYTNIKITTPEDMPWAEFLLKRPK